jgi:hypothetical protein
VKSPPSLQEVLTNDVRLKACNLVNFLIYEFVNFVRVLIRVGSFTFFGGNIMLGGEHQRVLGLVRANSAKAHCTGFSPTLIAIAQANNWSHTHVQLELFELTRNAHYSNILCSAFVESINKGGIVKISH